MFIFIFAMCLLVAFLTAGRYAHREIRGIRDIYQQRVAARKRLASDAIDAGHSKHAVSAGEHAGAAVGATITGLGLAWRGFRRGFAEGWPQGEKKAREIHAKYTAPNRCRAMVERTGRFSAVSRYRTCGQPIPEGELLCDKHDPDTLDPQFDPAVDIEQLPEHHCRYRLPWAGESGYGWQVCGAEVPSGALLCAEHDGVPAICPVVVETGDGTRVCGADVPDGLEMCERHTDEAEYVKRGKLLLDQVCGFHVGTGATGGPLLCGNALEEGERYCRVHSTPPAPTTGSDITPTTGGSDMAIETATGGEVASRTQLKAELEAFLADAMAELDDARAELTRIDQDTARIELMVSSMDAREIDSNVRVKVQAIMEMASGRKEDAASRITRADQTAARARAAIEALDSSAQGAWHRD